MNIHEYQAKGVLAARGVPILQGKAAFTVDEAVSAAKEMGGTLWVVKAQIHAGGRGKAGGVILARSIEEVQQAAEKLLGMTLVTHQTGPKGRIVKRIFVEEGCDIANELYLSAVIDRKNECVSFIASAEGGVDIEKVAAETPEKIVKITVDPAVGYQAYQGRKAAFALGLEGQAIKQFGAILKGIYTTFMELDASLVEINPLVVTKSGDLVALDAKMNFDDNGLFRHPEVEELRDEDEEDPMERQAAEFDLSYVKLDGNIGCMVNGAGLAMSTMDIIKLHGAEPANFLDVGGGASHEKVAAAFKLILADPNVEAILINIFGGIMRCDVIAEGIISAAQEVSLTVPMVVRLQGTNGEIGKKILAESNLNIISAEDLDEAAQKVVQVAQEAA